MFYLVTLIQLTIGSVVVGRCANSMLRVRVPYPSFMLEVESMTNWCSNHGNYPIEADVQVIFKNGLFFFICLVNKILWWLDLNFRSLVLYWATTVFSIQLIVNKICQWLDSNLGSQESEATALSTEPQLLPLNKGKVFWDKIS